jgi:hypothetical protein
MALCNELCDVSTSIAISCRVRATRLISLLFTSSSIFQDKSTCSSPTMSLTKSPLPHSENSLRSLGANPNALGMKAASISGQHSPALSLHTPQLARLPSVTNSDERTTQPLHYAIACRGRSCLQPFDALRHTSDRSNPAEQVVWTARLQPIRRWTWQPPVNACLGRQRAEGAAVCERRHCVIASRQLVCGRTRQDGPQPIAQAPLHGETRAHIATRSARCPEILVPSTTSQ